MDTQAKLSPSSDYALLVKQAEALLTGETDPIANAANLASLLFYALEDVNWVGFYYLQGNELVLGPFCGQPACTRIQVGQGVCGTAIAERVTQVVADVRAFAGHIACDAASRSEVVVPFFAESLSGVLDIDSPIEKRFSDAEQALFETVAQLYVSSIGG